VDQEELDQFIARREAELREEFTGFDPASTEALVADALRDEVAEKTGADPAALEAVQMVRQYGTRRSLRLLGGGDVAMAQLRHKFEDEEGSQHRARVIGYIEQMRAELPWWRRILS